MKTSFPFGTWRSHALVLALATSLVPAAGFAENSCKQPNAYTQRNLVSDEPDVAEHVDPNLVNPWGIAFNPFGLVWVSDNETGLSTLYDGNGVRNGLVVSIPSPSDPMGGGKPTGIIFNGASNQFLRTEGGVTSPAVFIFSTEQGTIAGWFPFINPTQAITVARSSSPDAIYKGLAFSGDGTRLLLYATDFHNAKIDVFDNTFTQVSVPGSFEDPFMPRGFAPFGIQNINGNLYVTYAKQDADREDDVAGKGLGYVNIFDTNGRLVKRLVSRGKLNAPWGMALAPASFGKFGNKLLVGNFGDGVINVYDPQTGHCSGQLERPDGSTVRIEGLWGLSFGNGVQNQPTDTLFFTAGPDDEEHGLYGRLDAVRRDCRGFAPEPEPASDAN